MTMLIVGALAPVFGLILIGYGCGRFNLLGDRAFEVLNRFVIIVSLPVLTFRTIAHIDARDLAVPGMMVAVIGGAAVAYALGFLIEKALGRRGSEANIAGLASSFSNTGFIGLPVALLAFGQRALAPVAVTMLLYSAVVFTVGVLVSELAGNHGTGAMGGVRLAARAVLRSPLILLSSLGVLWTMAGLPLSGPADVLLETLAGATAPCALTAIGLFIALPRESAAPGPIARAVAMKLVLHPLATAGFVLLLPMPPIWGAMAILMAAMPSGATSFVLAGKAGRWAMELSAWTVMLTTIGAAVTLVPFIWWLSSF